MDVKKDHHEKLGDRNKKVFGPAFFKSPAGSWGGEMRRPLQRAKSFIVHQRRGLFRAPRRGFLKCEAQDPPTLREEVFFI